MSRDVVTVLISAVIATLNPSLLAAVTVMLLLPQPKRLMLGYLLGACVKPSVHLDRLSRSTASALSRRSGSLPLAAGLVALRPRAEVDAALAGAGEAAAGA